MNELSEVRANFQTIDSSFRTITKPSSNQIRETFCGGLERSCELFEINGEIDF